MNLLLDTLIFLILPALAVIFAVIAIITKLYNHLLLAWMFTGLLTLLLIGRAILRWWKMARLRWAVNKAFQGTLALVGRTETEAEAYSLIPELEAMSKVRSSAELKLQEWKRETWVSVLYVLLLLILPIVATLRYGKFQSYCSNQIGPGAALEACNFGGRDLSGMNLRGANLKRANLANAILSQAHLSGADLADANLRDADLSGAALDGAALDGADLQGAIGLTDDMLTNALNVTDDMLASTLSQRSMRLEPRDVILQGLKDVCLGVGIVEAGTYAPDKSFHPLVLLSAQGEAHKFTGRVLDEWEPMAMRFSELVACAEEEQEVVVERCSYIGGPQITRYRYQMHVRLVAANTGDIVAERTFGTTPSACPKAAHFLQTRIGEHVDFKDIELFLEEYVNLPQP